MSRYEWQTTRTGGRRYVRLDSTPIPRSVPVQRAAPTIAPVAELSTLLKADVVSLAESRGVDTTGTKADIIARLSDG